MIKYEYLVIQKKKSILTTSVASALFLVFPSSLAVIFRILTMFRAAKVLKSSLLLVPGVPFLQPLRVLKAASMAA